MIWEIQGKFEKKNIKCSRKKYKRKYSKPHSLYENIRYLKIFEKKPSIEKILDLNCYTFECSRIYMNKFGKRRFDRYIYKGAWDDLHLNINTKFLHLLNDIELDKTKESIRLLLNNDCAKTSKSAILYNYYTNSDSIDPDNITLKNDISEFLIKMKNRFTIIFLLEQEQFDFDLFDKLIAYVLDTVSDIEKEKLETLIKKRLCEQRNTIKDKKQILILINIVQKFFKYDPEKINKIIQEIEKDSNEL